MKVKLGPRNKKTSWGACLLVLFFFGQVLIPLSTAQASSYTVEGQWYNDTIVYSFSGATLDPDYDDRGTGVRTHSAQINSNIVTLSGEVTSDSCFIVSRVRVILTGKDQKVLDERFTAGSSYTFTLTVELPEPGEGRGGYSIELINQSASGWHHNVQVTGGLYYSATPPPPTDISVPADEESTIPVTDIKIENCPESMFSGETITLKATVSPPNATNKNIVWMYQETLGALQSSHGSSLTTTADQGPFLEVTAISSCNNQIQDTCRIPVIHPIEIRLEPASLRLAPQIIEDRGRKFERVSVVVDPPVDGHIRVFWTSSDPDLVKVEPHGDGTEATITAFSPSPRDPSRYSEEIVGVIAEVEISGDRRWGLIREYYSCEVTIEFHPVEQVIIRPHRSYAYERHSHLLQLDGGQELVMEAMVLPHNATDRRVEWKTTNMGAGHLKIYPTEPFYTSFTAERGLEARVLNEWQDTYIIAKSVSNPEIADYLQLRSYGMFKPDRPDSVHDLSDQDRQIIDQPRQALPEDFSPTISADYSQGIPDHFPPPVIWEPEPKEAIPQNLLQFLYMNTGYYTWKILDYVPGKKAIVNAFIELTVNRCLTSALKELALGSLGFVGAAIDHIISAIHPEGDRWASVGEFREKVRERLEMQAEEHRRREQEEEERVRRLMEEYQEVPPPQ